MLLLSSRSGVLGRQDLSRLCNSRPWRCGARCLSAQDTRRNETINLKVGGSGTIKVSISHPVIIDKTLPRNILVQFSHGPVPSALQHLNHEPSLLQNPLLASRLPNATLVQVEYRLSTQDPFENRFPTPIHDSTTAFDFLTSSTSEFNHDHSTPPKLCLTGSHIGGALATMLILTEPDKVHALAVTSPIVDWVSLDEILDNARAFASPSSSTSTSRRRSTARSSSSSNSIDDSREDTKAAVEPADITRAARSLINLRGELFPTPSSYFDPFASPILFLRAPGKDTPFAKTAKIVPVEHEATKAAAAVIASAGDVSGLYTNTTDAYGPYDDDWQSSITMSGSASTQLPQSPELSPRLDSESDLSSSPSSLSPDNTTTTTSPKRRKVLRRWPPIGRPEDVLLPHVQIFLPTPSSTNNTYSSQGDTSLRMAYESIKHAQGTELAELMRKACFFGREKGFAEQKVGVGYLRPYTTRSRGESGVDVGMNDEVLDWIADVFARD